MVYGTGSAPKVLVSYNSSVIRGFTKKGSQFFGLELNNLTEPIKCFKINWPNEIYICGHYIYNNYIINVNENSKNGSVVQSKNYYVCPERINEIVIVENKHQKNLSKFIHFFNY